MLASVGAWMHAPRDVATLFIEDSVTPDDTATVFDQAGLLPLVFTPVPGQPWPTLGTMIGSVHRLVVLSARKGGGTAAAPTTRCPESTTGSAGSPR